jgi:magnesium-transporting ATPase (P-type)
LPSDILVIASSGREGLCYVETKNLDGETNMKHRVAPKDLNNYFLNKIERVKDLKTAEITCEVPNKDLANFDGKMILP